MHDACAESTVILTTSSDNSVSLVRSVTSGKYFTPDRCYMNQLTVILYTIKSSIKVKINRKKLTYVIKVDVGYVNMKFSI